MCCRTWAEKWIFLLVRELSVRLICKRFECVIDILPLEALARTGDEEGTGGSTAHVIEIAIQRFPGFLRQENLGADFSALPLYVTKMLVLILRKLQPQQSFYQTLGVDLVEEQHGKGPVHFAGRAGAVVIEVYPLPDEGSPVDSSTRLGFAVENLAMIVQALQGNDTLVAKQTTQTARGCQAVVKDPDGQSVELTQH